RWIDNQFFAFLSMTDRSIYVVDALNSSNQNRLPGLDDWYILTVSPITGTRMLLIGAKARKSSDPNTPQFLTYNLDSSTINILPYGVLGNQFKEYFDLEFSTDGKRFF